jgi:hypothetical protein
VDLTTEAIAVIKRFKNVILEGPPGTGKTFVVGKVAEQWTKVTGRTLGGDGSGRYAMTFHPSTTYEQFVDGLRYDERTRSFIRKPGFILEIVKNAREHPDQDFLVLVDEINRANVPKVLGDLLLCMEPSKRATFVEGQGWSGTSITLPYSGDLFMMPENIYIVGTMNTSDRSIATLDSALRRRFGFLRVPPLLGDELRDVIIATEGPKAATRVAQSVDELTNLNIVLRECLGPNAMLGHSYLFDVPEENWAVDRFDPLASVRKSVIDNGAHRILWLEITGSSGGSENQLDIPSPTNRGEGRQGLLDCFYPMSSRGVHTNKRSSDGEMDFFDVHFHEKTLYRCSIQYNSGGKNYRMKFGQSEEKEKILDLVPDRIMTQKIIIWVAHPDDTFEMFVYTRTPEIISALKGLSSWSERTMKSQSGRSYGMLDPNALKESAPGPSSEDSFAAQRMTWRYAILPQLVDTLAQLGASDLFNEDTRGEWLQRNNTEGLMDRFQQFDHFLSDMGFGLAEEGHGVGRTLAIKDVPAGATTQIDTASQDATIADAMENNVDMTSLEEEDDA